MIMRMCYYFFMRQAENERMKVKNECTETKT